MIIIPYCILIHQAVFYNELLRQYTIEYRVLVKRCEPYIKVKYADLYKTKSKKLMKYYQEFLDTCNKNPTFNSTIHGNMSLPGYSSKQGCSQPEALHWGRPRSHPRTLNKILNIHIHICTSILPHKGVLQENRIHKCVNTYLEVIDMYTFNLPTQIMHILQNIENHNTCMCMCILGCVCSYMNA